jgi:predicted metal-dependent HD superfamily phosphohydrolase
VVDLIMATKHHSPPADSDAALVVDVDLAILGQPEQRFAEYEQQIRQEYAWVPQPIFTSKRSEILQRFLDREHIYATESFRQKYEARARQNLEQAIQRARRARASIRRIATAVLAILALPLLAYALWRMSRQ